MKSATRFLAIALVALVAAPVALASGFHVYEQGSKASGQAVAFIARADDGSAAYYNPAAVVKIDGLKVDFGVSFIFLGKTDFESKSGSTAASNPLYGLTSPVVIFPADQKFNMKDHTPNPIHLGIAYHPTGSRFGVSFAVTNPFGLITDWSDTPDFSGRFSAITTDLRTFDYALNGSMDFGGGFSGSVGVDYLTADLRAFTRDLLIPAVLLPPTVPAPTYAGQVVLHSDLTGTGHELGWNAALHYKAPTWSVGALYRSKFDVKVDGTATFTPVAETAFIPVPPGALSAGVLAAFPSGGGHGELRLPATYGVGFAYTGLKGWEFELDVNQVQWSHFDEIPVRFDNPIATGSTTSVPEHWDTTTSFRLGMAYDINDNNQVRFGAYSENNPIPAETLRPSIPDGKRTGVTVGYGAKFGKIGLDIYWLHIFISDETVNLENTTATPAAAPAGVPFVVTNNAAEIGRIGTYKSGIDLVGLTLGYKW